MDLLANLNLSKNEIQNAKIQNLSSAPSSPVTGQVYYDTTLGRLGIYTGSVWFYFASQTELNSAIEGIKWKDACRVATTANITLSGTQTIDGVSVVADERVLVKNQTTASQNGIYLCKASAWVRANDGSTGTELVSAVIPISEGTSNADTQWRITNDSITIDSTSIVVTQFGSTVPDATTTVKGIVELATQAETEGQSDTIRAVTPSGLVNFAKKATFNVGDGSSTSIVLTHNFNTRDIIVAVVRNSSPYDAVLSDIESTTVNTVTLKFAVAPTSNQFRALVIA